MNLGNFRETGNHEIRDIRLPKVVSATRRMIEVVRLQDLLDRVLIFNISDPLFKIMSRYRLSRAIMHPVIVSEYIGYIVKFVRLDAAIISKSTPHNDVNIVDNMEVFEYAKQIFGSDEAAINWLNTPSFTLGLKRPLELLRTNEGRKVVRDLLVQIDYGVYA